MTILGQMLEQKGMEKGMEYGIKALILTCQEFGASKEETRRKIISGFSLPEQKTDQYLTKYWPESNTPL